MLDQLLHWSCSLGVLSPFAGLKSAYAVNWQLVVQCVLASVCCSSNLGDKDGVLLSVLQASNSPACTSCSHHQAAVVWLSRVVLRWCKCLLPMMQF